MISNPTHPTNIMCNISALINCNSCERYCNVFWNKKEIKKITAITKIFFFYYNPQIKVPDDSPSQLERTEHLERNTTGLTKDTAS